MAFPPAGPVADPLLEPDAGPRDASGEVVRAPLGNSIRTLLAFLALAAVGVAIWWTQRPSDLTERLAGTEWVVVDVDGVAAANPDGQVAAFALGRRSMLRAGGPCGLSRATWTFDIEDQRLEVDWRDGAPNGCANEDESWTVAAPTTGKVELRGAELTVRGTPAIRAFSVTATEPADSHGFAGRWSAGETMVEIGERGLFRIGECMGHWSDAPNGVRWAFESSGPECALGEVWSGRHTYVPLRFEESLYLWRVAPGSAFDPFVLRLEPVADNGSPLLGDR